MGAGRGRGASRESRGATAMVEIMFCATTHGVVRLDGVVASGPKRGWPFSMQVALPQHPGLSVVAERMLARWSVEGALVSVDVRARRHPTGVRLCDGSAAILLDVAGAGSVFS